MYFENGTGGDKLRKKITLGRKYNYLFSPKKEVLKFMNYYIKVIIAPDLSKQFISTYYY